MAHDDLSEVVDAVVLYCQLIRSFLVKSDLMTRYVRNKLTKMLLALRNVIQGLVGGKCIVELPEFTT